MNRGKLAIGIPHFFGNIHPQFFDSWTMMDKPDFTYIRPPFYAPIDVIRNQIVEAAIEAEADYLLMMDTDQIYPQETIRRLWDSFWCVKGQVGAIGAKTFRRYPPFDPLMLLENEDNAVKKYRHCDDHAMNCGKLVEVDATGTGCILYNMEVFKMIHYPWFVDQSRESTNGPGEDIGFCQKMKRKGFSIWVHTGVSVTHLTTLEVNQASYDLYKQLTKERNNAKSNSS